MAENYDILIKNGKVWNGEKFLENACDIGIKDGIITKIGNIDSDSAFIYDAKGKIVSAGLVDIHIHAKGLSEDKYGVPAESVCFPFGVTTFADANTELTSGNQMLSQMLISGYVFLNVNVKNGKPDFSLTQSLIDVYKDKVLGIKVFLGTSPSNIKDVSALSEICGFAAERALKVLVHTTNTLIPMHDVLSNLKKGDICTHIYHGGENTVLDDNFECLKNARARGVILDNGMAGGVHTDFSIAKKAIENNILPDTISTDITKKSAFIRGGNFGMTLCMSIMRTLGMKEEDILKCVTVSAAKAIGKENICGKIDVQRNADISVLDYTHNPFNAPCKWGENVKDEMGYKNLLTIKKGQVVFRG